MPRPKISQDYFGRGAEQRMIRITQPFIKTTNNHCHFTPRRIEICKSFRNFQYLLANCMLPYIFWKQCQCQEEQTPNKTYFRQVNPWWSWFLLMSNQSGFLMHSPRAMHVKEQVEKTGRVPLIKKPFKVISRLWFAIQTVRVQKLLSIYRFNSKTLRIWRHEYFNRGI